ncbi:MAG: hypothetical protein JXR25_11590 [Pontiellaceae bacterium]|nr:hypothetical protein [Pontiellaceae bacterium]MBN2785457.1 hypothetical protein [Pontiellaceae bacterium]
MKKFQTAAVVVLAGLLSGCATSSRVQQMIDAANSDRDARIQSHEESIGVLRETAKAGLETSSGNSEQLRELVRRMDELIRQMAVVQDLANGAKVMSAEINVKVSGLEDRLMAHQEKTDASIERMTDIDKLYEEVLIRQFQEIASSANAAAESLRKNGFSATNNVPVMLDELIQIVAPDTSAPTNTSGPE